MTKDLNAHTIKSDQSIFDPKSKVNFYVKIELRLL